MILYNEQGILLGISHNILQFLGYEDMEDFKTYANDVVDLFVKKAGFIYKYDDFLWIKYVLHSGAAKKIALVHLKNGDIEEVSILIKEIFLTDELQGGIYYGVDLIKKETNKSIEITNEDIFLTNQPKEKEIEKIKANTIKEPLEEDTNKDELFFLEAHKLPMQENNEIKENNDTIINMDAIESFLGLEYEDILQLIKDFLDYSDSICLELYNAIQENDHSKMNNFVLAIENSAQMLCFKPLVTLLESFKNSSIELDDFFEKYINIIEKIKKEVE